MCRSTVLLIHVLEKSIFLKKFKVGCQLASCCIILAAPTGQAGRKFRAWRARASSQDSNFGPAWLNLGFAGISNFNREPCHAESTAINFFLFISNYISLIN